MSDFELSDLLAQAKKDNKIRSITGMLLYFRKTFINHSEGRFIQVLEGKEKDVIHVFNKIKTDTRHFDIEVLCQMPIIQRNFKSWSMGFEILEEEKIHDLQGGFNLNSKFFIENQGPINPSLDLLKLFYLVNMRLLKDSSVS